MTPVIMPYFKGIQSSRTILEQRCEVTDYFLDQKFKKKLSKDYMRDTEKIYL